jgi:hypothetical protein
MASSRRWRKRWSIRGQLRPFMVELRPKRADLRAFFWGKSSVFPEVFAGPGRVRAAKCVKPKGGRRALGAHGVTETRR